MHLGMEFGELTHSRSGWASILALTAGINWAALGSWIGSRNWVAISTTIGLVIFNVAVGWTAAVNYYHAGRAKHRREQEDLDKDSWSVKFARMTRVVEELTADRDVKDREIAELRADNERMTIDAAALRESAHKQRGELNRQVLDQVNESNELRRKLWDLNREVEELRMKVPGNNQPKGSV